MIGQKLSTSTPRKNGRGQEGSRGAPSRGAKQAAFDALKTGTAAPRSRDR
ncbi:hypothetical protein ACRAWD_24840 [Caulobacter segnis]